VEIETGIPNAFSLEQNYPNPFNPETHIKYTVGSSEFVTLKVYDVLGNEVATLVNEVKPSGTYDVSFRTDNLPTGQAGVELSSGVYFYTLKAGSFIESKKMLLLR
jgi:hypothetical protein